MADDNWLRLARCNQKARLEYERLAEEAWRVHDYINAIRFRGLADGIHVAQNNQVSVSQQEGDDDD